MGEFINQVQKNNMLQNEILSEKQKRTLEREKKQFYKKVLTKYQLQIFDEVKRGTDAHTVSTIIQNASERLKENNLTTVERKKLVYDLEKYYIKEKKANISIKNFYDKNNLANLKDKYKIDILNDLKNSEKILEQFKNVLDFWDLSEVEKIKLCNELKEFAEKKQKSFYKENSKNNLEDATAVLYNYLQQHFTKYGIYIESELLKQKYNILDILCNNYNLNTIEKIKLEKSFDNFYNKFLKTYKKQNKLYKSNLKNNSRLAGKIIADIIILIIIILILL